MTTSENPIIPAAPAPKYRHFTTLPEFLYLKADDLTAFLPEDAWIGASFHKEREIAVPAAKILETNYPRIRFSQLRDLLPDCIRQTDDAPEWIALPADRVALAYKLETRRELLPDAVVEKTSAPVTPPSEAPSAEEPIPAWKRLPKPILAPPPEAVSVPEPATGAVASPQPASLAEILVPAASEPRLQEIFGKNAALPVPRLLEWCHALPDVKACQLSRGAESVKAGDFAASLAAPCPIGEVFAASRKFSETSGVKLKPAITLYTDDGAISFIRHRKFTLTLVHATGGLATETRAKLKMLLQAIDRAAAPQG